MNDNLEQENQNVADENNDTTVEESGEGVELNDDQLSSQEDDSVETSTTNANESGQDSEKKEPTDEEKKEYAFKKKAWQLQQERQKAEGLAEENRELKAKLDKRDAPKRPEVSELPDTFDPEYEAKMAERDAQLIDRDRYDRQEEYQKEQQQATLEEQQKSRVQAVQQQQADYAKNSTDLKLNQEEMAQAEQVVTSYITPANAPTAGFILGHEHGPLIVKALGDDPVEMGKVASMQPLQASVYITNTVLPKALKAMPSTTKTPDPISTPTGKGAPKSESPYLKGCTIE